MSLNLLLEDNAYDSMPIGTSEEHCYPPLIRIIKKQLQKLMAMLSNFPIEDNAYESLLACTSKKQCVPVIDPKRPSKFQRTRSSVEYNSYTAPLVTSLPLNILVAP